MRNKRAVFGAFFALAFFAGICWWHNDAGTLKGNQKLSNRSKEQLFNEVVLAPHVVGAYVVKTAFSKSESPLIWVAADSPGFWKLTTAYIANGGGKGIGSEYFKDGNRDDWVVTVAIKRGEVVCAPIENTALFKLINGVEQYVKTSCFLPIPPNSEFKQIIVVLYDLPMDELDQEILHNELSKVQLDVYNREYLGKETWVEIARSKP